MAYLREYLNRIRDTYTEARGEYTALQNERESVEKRYQAKLKSGELTKTGRAKATEHYREAVAGVDRRLEDLMRKTEERFEQTRTAVDFMTKDDYGLNPEKLDMNALELLKSGIMTDSELQTMAQNFKGNPTMRRMIGKYAKERADKDPDNLAMRTLAVSAGLPEDNVPLGAVDALIGWGRSGLRSDRLLADKIAEVYEQETADIFKKYGDIQVGKN